MNKTQFFMNFWEQVQKTPQWATMATTVEGSEWHREANVAVHTTMCIEHYLTYADQRSDRQQILTLMTLLFHDFGKPEAEETLEAKDGSGRTYHRYAGHEPVSANEFISFMCEHKELTKSFFAQGFDWEDIRKIKFMIEHHLPFGLKNATKRQNLRNAVAYTLGADEQCFYDQLWSDCNGRISDDHETKRNNVVNWIDEFRAIPVHPMKVASVDRKTMFVLVGTVGVGKTTWIQNLRRLNPKSVFVVISEDAYRLEFHYANLSNNDQARWVSKPKAEAYAEAWQYCFEHSADYDRYAKEMLKRAVSTGETLIVDRTNQTRKARGPWVAAGRGAGYAIRTIEFYIDEATMHARQKTRGDKSVPYNRAHQIFMNIDVPQVGVEVDSFEIVPPWN